MTPRTFVITGASDGIGAAAARLATASGHEVVIVGRDPRKTAAVAASIGAEHHAVDFADLGAVVGLADALVAAHPRVDVLANNAGGVFRERTVTADGFEKTWQVNHLAPFVLTSRLLPVLESSGARVVTTSSLAARRHGNSLTSTSFHPGVIASNFGAEGSRIINWFYTSAPARALMPSPEDGAARLLWLAEAPEGAGWAPGGYHVRNRPVAIAGDAARLWDATEALVAPWL